MRSRSTNILLPDLATVTTEMAKDPENMMVQTLNDGSGEIKPGARVILCRWADEWINSGLKPNGAEVPAARKMAMAKTPKADSATEALFEFSQRWLGILPGSADGRPTLSMAEPEQIFKEMRTDQEEAKFYLALLLLTPFRDYVAKCRRDGCGLYFALKQNGREYQTGTICRTCCKLRDRKQSADSMGANREMAEQKLYGLIAAKFRPAVSEKDWHLNQNLRNRMAAFLNREIAADEKLRPLYTRRSRIGITPAWVNRIENRIGINDAIAIQLRQKRLK